MSDRIAKEDYAQPLDSDLTAIAALSTTSFGRAFLTLADAAAARSALGIGNTVSNYLSGDVSLTQNQFGDGPSVSCIAGTWLLAGCVACDRTGGVADFTCKLWDGTTTISVIEFRNDTSTVTESGTIVGIATPGSTTTYKISVAPDNSSCQIRAAPTKNSPGNFASFLIGVKIG